jgi:hypothetical protein
MNLKTKLAASLLLAASTSMAQAALYNVSAVFKDGGIQGVTTFDGNFDWDGTTVSNFTGNLSESMFAWDATNNRWWDPLSNSIVNAAYTKDIYAKPGGYKNGDAPLLHLTFDNLVPETNVNGVVTAMTFLKNSTDVVAGGGYNVDTSDGGTAMAYGMPTQAARNNNGFFTLLFDATDPTNVTTALLDKMVYTDNTRLGMMGPYYTGWLGMTGLYGKNLDPDTGDRVLGSMGGYPFTLSITAVPVPGAVWLFGSALMGLIGVNRRKSVLA